MAKLAYPLQLAIAGSAYFATGWLSLEAFALINSSASPVWPPTGIAIAALMIGGYRLWPAFLVGAFLFNFMTSGHVPSSAIIGIGNTSEALAGAWLANRLCGGREAFHHAPNTLAFGGLMMVPAAISASVGVYALVLFDLAPRSLAGAIWQTWWLGDLAGALVVTPLIVLWARKWHLPRDELLIYGVSAGVAALVFLALPNPALLLLPLLVAWAAIAKGPRVMAGVTILIAAMAVLGTLQGLGPFQAADANLRMLDLQVFLAFFSATTLVLAAGTQERNFERKTRQSGNFRSAAIAIFAMLPLFLASMLSYGLVGPSYEEFEEQNELEHLDAVAQGWVGTLEGHEAWLKSAKGMLEANPNLSRTEFHHYVEHSGWLTEYGGLQAAGINVFVRPGEEQALIDTWNSDPSLAALGYPEPKQTLAGSGYYVDKISPISGNEAAFGFDIYSEPIRRAAIEEAVKTGQLTATAPVTLVQETGSQQGFLMIMPLYQGGDPGTEELRQQQVFGLVVSVHRGNDVAEFVANTVAGASGVEFTVDDLEGHTPLANSTGAEDLPLTTEISFAGRSYEVHVSKASGQGQLSAAATTFVLGTGGLLSVAATMAVYAYDSTRHRAHDAAVTMNRRLTETQKVARLGSWEWDIPKDEISWSPQLFKLFGQNPDTFDTSFEGYMSCIHPDDREMIQGIVYSAFETGNNFSTDHRVVWPDGTVRWIHGLGYVEQGSEGPIRMMGTAQDVTDRVNLEADKRRASQQKAELEHLRRVDEFKSNFVNTASHELRTPLSPIMMQLHILKNSVVAEDEASRKSLEILDRNMHRIKDLIDDFVSSSQYQAGKLAVNAVEDDLGELIHGVYESFLAPANDKGITLELDCEGECITSFDHSRLSQVFYNLLSNAMKFTPKGGKITVKGEQTKDEIKISVIDTGQGMSEENIKKLFAPFSQVHDPMSVTERGSGLGLYICKGIAEGHGGTIEASSPGEGQGSTFTLRLPLGEARKS